jgi:hypothetical protein
MAIADGTKTVEGIRESTAEKVCQIRARKSSPVRTGENARDLEASAERMRARHAKIDTELNIKNARNIFILNCDTARVLAATYDGPADADTIRNCKAVVHAWTALLKRLTGDCHGDEAPSDDGLGIPECLRRSAQP